MSLLGMGRFAEPVARAVPANPDRAMRFATGRRLRFATYGSAGLALLPAAASAYWALGAGASLSSVGGDLEAIARSGGAAAVALGAGTTAELADGPLALVWPCGRHLPQRLLDGLALAAAALLVAYGGLLVLVGAGSLLGLTGSAPAEPTALRWHALCRDPWSLSTATDRRSRTT